jgi:hypothetical protein
MIASLYFIASSFVGLHDAKKSTTKVESAKIVFFIFLNFGLLVKYLKYKGI